MIDQLTGNVFNVGRYNTQNLSTKNYMKAMGAREQVDPVEYEMVLGEDAPMETGTDASEAYVRQIQRLNNFGLAMSMKGIDVINPNPNDPQSLEAAQHFNRLRTEAGATAVARKTAHDLSKYYTTQRLKPNVVGTDLYKENAQGGVDSVTSQNLDNLVDLNPYKEQVNALVNDANKLAKSYNSQAERDAAELQLEKKREALSGYRDKLIQAGIPAPLTEQIIQNGVDRINSATYNPNKDEDQELREKRVNSQNANDRQKRALARRGAQDQDAGALRLLTRMYKLNQGRGFDNVDMANIDFEDDLLENEKLPDGKKLGKVKYNNGRAVVQVIDKDNLGAESVVEERPLDLDLIMEVIPTQGERQNFLRVAREKGFIDENGNLNIEQNQGQMQFGNLPGETKEESSQRRKEEQRKKFEGKTRQESVSKPKFDINKYKYR